MRLRCSLTAIVVSLAFAAAGGRAAAPPDVPPAVLAYQLTPEKPLVYRLTATINGSLPLFENPEPTQLNAVLGLVYRATPKALLDDGTTDVALSVESADLEIEKVPFPIPLEEVQKVLDQTITLSRRGEIKRVLGGSPVPFSVSIPGVDPKRLYALLFPIVFPDRPIREGETWAFKSELLGGEGAEPSFTATLLPHREPADAPTRQLREEFSMGIDQRLGEDKKPVGRGKKVHMTRKGRIEGKGLFHFDSTQGCFMRGEIDLTANITETRVGKPIKKDEPKQVISKVRAKVLVELQPATTADAPAKGAPDNKEKP